MWDLPRLGIEPMSPALAGRFFFFFFWQADSYPLDHQGSPDDRVLTEEDLSLLRTLCRFCWNMFEGEDGW